MPLAHDQPARCPEGNRSPRGLYPNYSLRKVLKGRSAFPNDESIIKVLFMGLQHVAKKWTQPIPEWKVALNQFVILFGERVQV